MILHGYFRSSASWRVRIALELKGLAVEHRSHHLRKGEQRAADYLRLNPQGLVPALALDDGRVLTQSLAILEYLDEVAPEPPLLPGGAAQRAEIRALAQIIACDVHPLQNLKVLDRIRALAGDAAARQWAQTVIREGLDAFEAVVSPRSGAFACGERPTLADVVLIPQLGNARRFGLEVSWPRIAQIEENCMRLEAFRRAVPERQPDAE
ncbi:MAG TPA: maleylacetoacetate isomerase [Croceibacterium sp.]|nr:maleylacetoacetate isomerase [Croceibacterium sp.]